MIIQYVRELKLVTNAFGTFVYTKRKNRPARIVRGLAQWKFCVRGDTVQDALRAYSARHA